MTDQYTEVCPKCRREILSELAQHHPTCPSLKEAPGNPMTDHSELRQGSTWDTADSNPVPGRDTAPGCCDHFIEIPDNPWAGTYCKLLAGHWGKHSAHYHAAWEPHRSWKPTGQQILGTSGLEGEQA